MTLGIPDAAPHSGARRPQYETEFRRGNDGNAQEIRKSKIQSGC
jgi:hypothetical protein